MLPFEIEKHLVEIQNEVEKNGAELVDIVYRKMTGRSILTVIADKAGGITLEDCVAINQGLGRLLDEWSLPGQESAIQGAYYLEVNSPGLDRPLKTPRDYARAMGQELRVVSRAANGAVLTNTGILRSVSESEIGLEKNGETFTVSLESIIKTTRELKFKKQ